MVIKLTICSFSLHFQVMDFKGVFFELDDFEIDWDKSLGKGNFGVVYLAKRIGNSNLDTTDEDLNKLYAAKILNIDSKRGFKAIDQMKLMREATILHLLDHPSIVRFYGVNFQSFSDPSCLGPTIITEYLPKGSINDLLFLKRNSKSPPIKITSTMKLKWLLGISHALLYLHHHGMIHRDLKSDNVLLDEEFNPHVCDFGLSRCFPTILSASITNGIGTPIYMAPELFDPDSQISTKVDVFAFAILTYEIITGTVPYHELSKKTNSFQLGNKISKGYRPKFPNETPESIKEFIEKCWSQNPDDRPTFDEIFSTLSHDFSLIGSPVEESEISNFLNTLTSNDLHQTNFDKELKLISYIKPQIDNLISMFQRAVESDNIDQIRKILSLQMINVNHRFKTEDEEKTALHIAVEHQQLDIVKLLLNEPDIDVNAKSLKSTNEIIAYSLIESDQDLFESTDFLTYFWEIPGNIRVQKAIHYLTEGHISRFGQPFEEKTPLYLAIELRNEAITDLLIQHKKIDPNIYSKIGKFNKIVVNSNIFQCYKRIIEETALHLAIKMQIPHIVGLLLNNKNTNSFLKVIYKKIDGACSRSRFRRFFQPTPEIKDCFNSYGTNHDYEVFTQEISSLEIAAVQGNLDIARYLLLHGVPLDLESIQDTFMQQCSIEVKKCVQQTALHVAIERGNIDMIKLFLKQNYIDLNKPKMTNGTHKSPLYLAIEKDNLEIVKLIVDNGQFYSEFITCVPNSPLHLAVKKGNIEIIKKLLKQDVQINAIDEEGKKPVDYTDDPNIIALFNRS